MQCLFKVFFFFLCFLPPAPPIFPCLYVSFYMEEGFVFPSRDFFFFFCNEQTFIKGAEKQPNRKHYKLIANNKLNKHKQGQLITKTNQKALTREGAGEVDPFHCRYR
jgi:hypothetical protein